MPCTYRKVGDFACEAHLSGGKSVKKRFRAPERKTVVVDIILFKQFPQKVAAGVSTPDQVFPKPILIGVFKQVGNTESLKIFGKLFEFITKFTDWVARCYERQHLLDFGNELIADFTGIHTHPVYFDDSTKASPVRPAADILAAVSCLTRMVDAKNFGRNTMDSFGITSFFRANSLTLDITLGSIAFQTTPAF